MVAESIVSAEDLILITGSTGFIGARVVESLLQFGFRNLRCFVRPSSELGRLENTLKQLDVDQSVELVSGDLLSQEDCRSAAKNASIILHLAAGVEKSFPAAFMNSALATRNLLDAFLQVGQPKRFVNVSSFAVYSNLRLNRGALLDETCPLEDLPQERFDAYAFGKLKQEEVVKRYGQNHKLPYVIVRPGAVFGPGKPNLSGRVGIDSFGFFMHLGGSNLLPLTYVDNCAEAIVLAGVKPGVDGEIFNIVDDQLPTSRQFLRAYKKRVPLTSVDVPYFLAYIMCLLWEKYCKWSKNQLPPAFNRRRCAADWKGNRYSNQKVKDRLRWKPRVKMEDGMAAFLAQFANDRNGR